MQTWSVAFAAVQLKWGTVQCGESRPGLPAKRSEARARCGADASVRRY
jgi:hypothetical protein